MKRHGARSRDKVTASAGEESPDQRVILPGRAPKPPKTGSRGQRHERSQFQKRESQQRGRHPFCHIHQRFSVSVMLA